jgi:hypothetical protein
MFNRFVEGYGCYSKTSARGGVHQCEQLCRRAELGIRRRERIAQLFESDRTNGCLTLLALRTARYRTFLRLGDSLTLAPAPTVQFALAMPAALRIPPSR